MDNLGIGEWIVIGLSAAILIFFFVGSWINNQRSMDTLRWLRRGLASLGEVKSARLGAASSAGVRMKIEMEENSPLQQILGNLALERRENLPLWIFQRLSGKRDRLILMAGLHPSSGGDFHIYHKSNSGPVDAARRGDKASLPLVKEGPEYSIYAQEMVRVEALQQAESWAAGYPGVILELSLQRKSPQIILECRLVPLLRQDAQVFFDSLRKIL